MNKEIKVLHLSDLHLDVNQKFKGHLDSSLVSFLLKKDFDILLISGDLTGNMIDSLETIDYIEKSTGKKVLFVPGNHDVWVEEGESSWEYLEIYKKHSSNLIGNPYILGDWAIVGGLSWYDFSFRSLDTSYNYVEDMKNILWNDSKYAVWGMSDKELHEKMLNQIKDDLEKVKDKKVWVSNHFIPYSKYLIYKNDPIWNFCNAFMGSEGLGNLLNKYKNIEVISFGHTHNRFKIEDYNGKTIVCRPLGYVKEWVTDDFIQELEDSYFIKSLT